MKTSEQKELDANLAYYAQTYKWSEDDTALSKEFEEASMEALIKSDV